MPSKKKVDIQVPDTVTGNSELDKKLLTLPEQSNREAIDTALLLQQLVRGQNSMLENQQRFGDEIVKLRERMDKYDQAAIKFEENKEKFIDDVMHQASERLATGDRKDKLIAKGANMFQEAIQMQKANIVTDQLAFEDMITRMPRVKVISPGKLESVIGPGGQAVPTLFPEEIRIKHKVWVLPPGQEIEVPEIVAQALKERRRIEAENDARSKVLQKNMNNDELIRELKNIDKQYGIKHEE